MMTCKMMGCMLLLTLTAVQVGGCSSENNPIEWWHQSQGGVIAQNRPPPPGMNMPYPHVGNTPMTTPDLPSPQYRTALTQRLEEQRNLAERVNTTTSADELVKQIGSPSPAGNKSTSTQTASVAHSAGGQASAGSSHTAQTPASTPSAQNPPASQSPSSGAGEPSSASASPELGTPGMVFDAADTSDESKPPPTTKQGQTSESEEALPEVKSAIANPVASGPLPQLPVAPPPSPRFPHFDIPTDNQVPDRVLPAYALADPPGLLVRFPQDSDVPYPHQEDKIYSTALKGVGHVIVVNGYGDARSVSPAVQAQALQVGLLRAKAVAKILKDRGVPDNFIQVNAYAFGHGARVVIF